MTRRMTGHLLASATILIWSLTYISTKILLRDLAPVEILFFRFSLAYLVLLAICPRELGARNIREELGFFSLGLTGIAAYYFLESLALRYTLASNVGLLISTAPLITAVLAHFTTGDEKIGPGFFLGCLAAAAGAAMIICNGRFVLRINPTGDLLALAAAASWAAYCILLKKIGRGRDPVLVTRKTFFYGVVCIAALAGILRPDLRPETGIGAPLLAHLGFLAVVASSLCFVMWGKAVKSIGVVSTSNYIYLVPFITAVSATLFLGEKLTALTILGGVMILSGVYGAGKAVRVPARAEAPVEETPPPGIGPDREEAALP